MEGSNGAKDWVLVVRNDVPSLQQRASLVSSSRLGMPLPRGAVNCSDMETSQTQLCRAVPSFDVLPAFCHIPSLSTKGVAASCVKANSNFHELLGAGPMEESDSGNGFEFQG